MPSPNPNEELSITTSKTPSLQEPRSEKSGCFSNVSPIEKQTIIKDQVPEAEADTELPDGGRAGWLVVLGCFLQAYITISWPLACGVFLEYFKSHNTFPGVNESVLGLLGATQASMLPIGSFFFGKLEDQYGYRRFIILGSVLHVLSVFLSAWSTKIWHFFITQGLMLGMSNGILFPILCALPAQWFRRRKAFATGIVIAGSSFGGGMNALIIRALLSHMSLRGVYLVQSGVEVVILGISFVLMKEREYPQRAEAEAPFNVEKQQISPDAKIEGSEDVESPSAERVQPEVLPRTKWLNSSLFRDSVFWSLEISLTIAVFGHLVPFLFLPLFIRSKLPGISSSLCTLPITIANISAFIGRIIVGLTADNFGPANTLFVSLFISGITQVIIWNLIGNFGANESSTYGMIMFFAILYGFWGGCFVSLLTPVGAQLFGSDQPANLSGLLVISGFPGYFAGPTLAGTILSCSNQNWHIVSLYAGGVQICGAVIFLWARFKRMPRIFVRF